MSAVEYRERAETYYDLLEKRLLTHPPPRVLSAIEKLRKKPSDAVREHVADELGEAPGTIWNLKRRRLKRVCGSIHDGLRDLLKAEIKKELRRNAEEYARLEKDGSSAGSVDLIEIAAQMAKLEEALKQ